MNKQAVKQRINFLRERLKDLEMLVDLPTDTIRLHSAVSQIMLSAHALLKEVVGDDSE